MLYKEEIKEVLECEIVKRYYFDNGKTVQAFRYDKALKKATEMINNKITTAAILKGEGSYKVIGKPN